MKNYLTPRQDKNNKFRVGSQILNSYIVGQLKYILFPQFTNTHIIKSRVKYVFGLYKYVYFSF